MQKPSACDFCDEGARFGFGGQVVFVIGRIGNKRRVASGFAAKGGVGVGCRSGGLVASYFTDLAIVQRLKVSNGSRKACVGPRTACALDSYKFLRLAASIWEPS